MKKFSFRFEAVERLRKTKEESALRALGAAQQALAHERDVRAKLERDMHAAMNRREQLGSIAVTPHAFVLEQDFIEGNKIRIVRQEQVIHRAQKRVDKAMRVFLDARKQTKMMEVLREKEHAEFKKKVAKHEQRELDDMVLMRARMTLAEETSV